MKLFHRIYLPLLLLLLMMDSVTPQDPAAEAPPEGEGAPPAEAPAEGAEAPPAEDAAPPAEDAAPPADGAAPPAEGEAPAAPAEGEASAAPAEGEASAAPAEGEAPAEPAEPAEGEAPAEPAEGEAPAEPAEGEAPAEPAEGEAPSEPGEEPENHGVEEAPEEAGNEEEKKEGKEEKGSAKCKPNEILTTHKGCVDRQIFLERVLQQTWMGEGLEAVKSKAGMEVKVECQSHEILTIFGCAPEKKPLRKHDAPRAPIVHSHLVRHQVYTSEAAGGVDTGNSKVRVKEIFGMPDGGRLRPRTDVSKETDTNSVKKEHMTKRGRYVFLPGRRIPSGRKCRPYEVLARHNRCIRRLGKVGYYEHKTHVYRS